MDPADRIPPDDLDVRAGEAVDLAVDGAVVEARFRASDERWGGPRLRLERYGDGIVRARWFLGAPAPRRSWDVLPAAVPATPPGSAEADARGGSLDAGACVARIDAASGRLSVSSREGQVLLEQRANASWRIPSIAELGIATLPGDRLPGGAHRVLASLAVGLGAQDRLWGFGERTGGLDRRGRTLSTWASDVPGPRHRGSDALYQAHPVFMVVRPGLAWGAYLHVTHFSRFDVGETAEDELRVDALGGEIDLFVMAGPRPADVLERLTRLTGRPALPPRWALGYHQSRWGYRSETDIRELVSEFRRRDLPLDAVHLDIDHMRGYRTFTFDPERFPDPARLARDLEDVGVHLVTIVDVGIKDDPGSGYGPVDEALKHGYVLRNADGSGFRGFVWPDTALFPDFARADVRAWWGGLHRDALVDVGIDGVWNDMNEPTRFDRPFSDGDPRERPFPLGLLHGSDDERAPHVEVRNVYATLEARAAYEGWRALRPDVRPWLLSRSGGPGLQRYSASWTGDNSAYWEHLALSIPELLGMGLSGQVHAGADVGGFWGNPRGELFARWMELGTFYPFLRNHTASGTAPQEPWAFGPDVEAVARTALRARRRLIPYLVSLAHVASACGAPLIRPVGYEFPDDAALLAVDDAFMLGPSLLVAPALRPGQRWRMVLLPPGRWWSFWSGEEVRSAAAAGSPAPSEAARPAVVPTPLGGAPALVRSGAIVPLAPERRPHERPPGSTDEDALHVLLAPGNGSFVVYEDDGVTNAWEGGAVARTPVTLALRGGLLDVEVGARSGSYDPPPRRLLLEILGAAPGAAARIDGAPVAATWEAGRRTLQLGWPDDGRAHSVTVAIDRER